MYSGKIIFLLAVSLSLLSFTLYRLTAAQELPIQEIIEKASPCIVQIVIYNDTGVQFGLGSGFFISPNLILTNAHVIENAYSAKIVSSENTYDEAIILKSDDEIDLALLQIDSKNESFLEINQDTEIRPGDRILTIGNPLGFEKTVSDGLISAIRGIPELVQIIQISAPISPGSSGGPLLNLQGSVIGIATAGVIDGQNINFAIGFETITKFLERSNNPIKLEKAGAKIGWKVVWKKIRKIFLLLIGLIFGGTWWLIGIIVIAIVAIVTWIFKVLKSIFIRFKKKKIKYEPNTHIEPQLKNYLSHIKDEEEEQEEKQEESIYFDSEKEKLYFMFHCWKCGNKNGVQFFNRPKLIICWNCHQTLEVPQEKLALYVNENVQRLFLKGKKSGFLDFQEIYQVLEDDIFTSEDFAEFLNILEKQKIQVLKE